MYFDTVVVAGLLIITATLCVSAAGLKFLFARIKEDAKLADSK